MKIVHTSQLTQPHPFSSKRAFTLIELLVVIAIIAILAAIIFPVFSTLQENARQNNTLEHMHDISSGLELYKLDNKSYPPVLFAYACDSTASTADGCDSADDTMETIGGDPKATKELVGLYPEYVRDWHSFTCASDTIDDPTGKRLTSAPGAQPQPNYISSGFDLVPADGMTTGGTIAYPFRNYYQEDAFDVGPIVSGNNTLATASPGPYIFTIRYQTAWTGNDTNYDASNTDGSPFFADYQRQLQWRNPPVNTYVTGVTYHVKTANKLIVLYEGGNAKNIPYGPANGNPDLGWDDQTQTDITPMATTTTGNAGTVTVHYVPAGFWRFDATGR